MKYLTKEWYKTEALSFTYSLIRTNKHAEIKSEEFFNNAYSVKLKNFVHKCKMDDIYISPVKELEKIISYTEAKGISEQDRIRRREYLNDYIAINRDKIERNFFFPFDKKTAERQFEENLKQMTALYANLPQNILDKIADIRVFALGYASAEVKKLLKNYCALKRQTSEKLKWTARTETAAAERLLNNNIVMEHFTEEFLMGIKKENNTVTLEFYRNYRLIFIDGEITEGENEQIFKWNNEIPNSCFSLTVAAELFYENGKFKACFLIKNQNEYDVKNLWELSIYATDIKLS